MSTGKIAEACQCIAEVDSDFAAALEQFGVPEPRNQSPGFEALFSAIVNQQISKQAGAAIMARARELLPGLNHRSLLAADEETLRRVGLSYRKIEYAKGLAEAIEQGQLDLDQLAGLTDEEVITQLTALRGFGRWSAEIYLMFCLQRPDVFPADDLALRIAVGKLKGLEQRPTAKQARVLIEPWAPWRSAGSLFLWHYYRLVK